MRDLNYLRYNRSGEVVEIIIRDFSGTKLDRWKFNISDTNKARNVMKMLKIKYNFEPEISHKYFKKKSKENKNTSKSNDLGWLA